jgi:hypothetical protein
VPPDAGLQKRANFSTLIVDLSGTGDRTRATCVAGNGDNRSAIYYDFETTPSFINHSPNSRVFINHNPNSRVKLWALVAVEEQLVGDDSLVEEVLDLVPVQLVGSVALVVTLVAREPKLAHSSVRVDLLVVGKAGAGGEVLRRRCCWQLLQ